MDYIKRESSQRKVETISAIDWHTPAAYLQARRTFFLAPAYPYIRYDPRLTQGLCHVEVLKGSKLNPQTRATDSPSQRRK